jgi:hypothetical protein
MKILIENYRNWQIFFDTDSENFYADTDDQISKEKKSYAAAKKYIDDFIKENNEFKPIQVEMMPSIGSSKITLTRIRKDGAIVYEDIDGSKKQFSVYSEDSYFLVDPNNEVHFNKLNELSAKIKELQNQIKETENLVVKVTVKEIKRNLLGK